MNETAIIVVNVVGMLVILYCARRATSAYIAHSFPELQRLSTQEARDAAVRRARPFFRVCSHGPAMVVGSMVISAALFLVLHITVLRFVGWWLTFLPCYAVIMFGLSLGNIYLARERMARAIRQQLVERTMPICAACGYTLEGLTEPRCPECGADFDPALLPPDPAGGLERPPDPPEPIELEVEYTDEVLRRGMHVYWLRNHGRQAMFSSVVLVVLLGGMIYYYGDRWYVGSIGTLAAIMMFQTYKSRQIMIQASVEKWGRKDDRVVRLRFADRGVDVETAEARASFEWHRLEKLWRTPRIWMLFQSRYEPMLLPAERLDPPLRELLTRKLLKAGVEVS